MDDQSRPRHPYQKFDGTPEWIALDSAIAELVENRDLQVTTATSYIVGYLCRAIAALKLE